MRLQIMETTHPIYRVVLEHPEWGVERHEVAVSGADYITSDEEADEFANTLLDMLEKKYNRYGMWDMSVYADYYIDGNMYTVAIERKEEVKA